MEVNLNGDANLVTLQCFLCLEPLTASDGFGCDDNHVLCWECLEGYSDSAMLPDAIRGYYNKQGHLLCPEPNCKLPYSLQKLATATNLCNKGHIFEKLLNLLVRVQSSEITGDALALQHAELVQNFKAIQANMDAVERRAQVLKLDIIENSLNVHCPRCGMIIYDFDGNLAYKCSSINCSCHFCIWCLGDFKKWDVMHEHVVNCPQSMKKGCAFCSFEELQDFIQARQIRLIREKVNDESSEVKQRLKQIMAGYIDDVDKVF